MGANPMPLIPGLPDDVSILCIAQIPFKWNQGLRFVSKSWMYAFTNGAIYEVRKLQNWLEKFLVVCLNTENVENENSQSTVLPLKLYDPREESWISLPSMPLWEASGQLLDYKCVSRGPDLFVVGGVQALRNERNRNGSQPIRVLRGASGMWELNEGVKNDRRSSAVVNIVGDDLFVGGIEAVEKNIRGENETVWRLTMKKFDSNRTWKVIKAPAPLIPLDFWVAGSIVIKKKIHVLIRMEMHGGFFGLVFDPQQETWETNSELSVGEFGMAGECPFVVVGNVVYGVWWEVSGHLQIGAKVMQFKQGSNEWVFVAQVPAQQDPNTRVVGYYVQCLYGKLYLLETGFFQSVDAMQAVSSIYVLKIPEGNETDFQFEWEVIRSPVGGNIRSQQKVLSCSVLEI